MASSSSSLPADNQWHTPVYAIWSDVSLNCMVCCCPACGYADTTTRLDGSRYAAWCPPCFAYTCSSFILSCALVGADTRRQIRETFDLPQEPCNDYLLHCFCCLCVLCQEAREIKYRSQLLAPPSLAAQLAPATDAPEVQLMARSKSKVASLKEWEWRHASSTAAGAASTAAPSPLSMTTAQLGAGAGAPMEPRHSGPAAAAAQPGVPDRGTARPWLSAQAGAQEAGVAGPSRLQHSAGDAAAASSGQAAAGQVQASSVEATGAEGQGLPGGLEEAAPQEALPAGGVEIVPADGPAAAGLSQLLPGTAEAAPQT